MIKFLLVIILVNSPIKDMSNLYPLLARVQIYCSYAGVDIEIKVKNEKNKTCERFLSWQNKFKYRDCITKTYHKKGTELVHFLRPQFKVGKGKTAGLVGGGLATVCSKELNIPTSGISAWDGENKIASSMVLIHELFHQLGASHSNVPNNVMLPAISGNTTGLGIAEETKQQIKQCLTGSSFHGAS